MDKGEAHRINDCRGQSLIKNGVAGEEPAGRGIFIK